MEVLLLENQLVQRLIAKKYKLAFLSSGLLYRYASFLILKYKPKNKLIFLKKNFKI